MIRLQNWGSESPKLFKARFKPRSQVNNNRFGLVWGSKQLHKAIQLESKSLISQESDAKKSYGNKMET